MTPDRRRALEARRAALRDQLARERVRQWMLDNHPQAVFGQSKPDQRDQVLQALGR